MIREYSKICECMKCSLMTVNCLLDCHCQKAAGLNTGDKTVFANLEVDGLYLAPSEKVKDQAFGHAKVCIAVEALSNKHKAGLHDTLALGDPYSSVSAHAVYEDLR